MARINTTQLRTWQNGDIIPAQDYNQERNLIIEANNDTNDKANLATQTSTDALNRVSRLEIQPTNIEETSIFQRLTQTLTEGQQEITLPTEYLPNTNRVQVFIDGSLVQVTETSSTSITLLSPARQGQTAVVHWVTELPRVFDLGRIEDAITSSKTTWLNPVATYLDLPANPNPGDTVIVLNTKNAYRYQNGEWLYIYTVADNGNTLIVTHYDVPPYQKPGELWLQTGLGEGYVIDGGNIAVKNAIQSDTQPVQTDEFWMQGGTT